MPRFQFRCPRAAASGSDRSGRRVHRDLTVHRIDPGTNVVVRRIRGVGYQALNSAGRCRLALGRFGSWPGHAHRPGHGQDRRPHPDQGRSDHIRLPDSLGTTLDHRARARQPSEEPRGPVAQGGSWFEQLVDELAIGYGSVCVAVADEETLLRIDPTTRRIVARIAGAARRLRHAHRSRRRSGSGRPRPSWQERPISRRPGLEPHRRPHPGRASVCLTSNGHGHRRGRVCLDRKLRRLRFQGRPETNAVVATYRLNSQPKPLVRLRLLWVDSYDASQPLADRPAPGPSDLESWFQRTGRGQVHESQRPCDLAQLPPEV